VPLITCVYGRAVLLVALRKAVRAADRQYAVHYFVSQKAFPNIRTQTQKMHMTDGARQELKTAVHMTGLLSATRDVH
jgi:hypothetical protein